MDDKTTIDKSPIIFITPNEYINDKYNIDDT